MSWLKGFNKKQTAAKGFQKQKSSQALQLQTFILEPILTPSGIIDTDDHSHDPVLDIIDTPTLPDVHLAETHPTDATDTSHVTSVETHPVSQIDLNSHPLTDPTNSDILANHSVDASISDSDLEHISFFDPTNSSTHSDSVAQTTDIHPLTVNESHDTDITLSTDNPVVEVSDATGDDVSHPLHEETSVSENHPITDASADSDTQVADGTVTHDRTSTEVAIASPTSEHTITDTQIHSTDTPIDTVSHPLEQHTESPATDNTHSITDVTDNLHPTTATDNTHSTTDVTDNLPQTTATDSTHSTTDDVTDNLPETTHIPPIESSPRTDFTSGVFTVGETGEVGVDFLFDGGGYKGELAIFSLKDMENLIPGSSEFIKEAAHRALSNSEFGHVVISDITEGAKFSGKLPGEGNQNSGVYEGVKTFRMNAGDEFGVMLVPNGKVQQLFDNPNAGGSLRPLFSMVTANPNEHYHIGQIADVTGDGNTFVMEDLRVDTKSDRDYNDIIFQVRGATGKAIHLDEVIAPGKDWRGSDMGQALIAYAEPYVTPDVSENVNLGDNGITEIPGNELDGYPEDGGYFDDGTIGFEDGGYFDDGTIAPEDSAYFDDGSIAPEDSAYFDDGSIGFEDGGYFDDGNIAPENIEYFDNNGIVSVPDVQISDVTESGIDTSTNITVDNLVSNIPAIENTQVTENAIAPDTTHSTTVNETVTNISAVETHPVTENAIAPDTTHSTTVNETVTNISAVETHPVTENAIASDTSHSTTVNETVANVPAVETHPVSETVIARDTTHSTTVTETVANVPSIETHQVTESAIAPDTTHSTTVTKTVAKVPVVETPKVTESAIAADTTSPTPASNVTTAIPSTPSVNNQTVVETSPITVDRTSTTPATEVTSTTEVETSAPITATTSPTVTNSNETEIFVEQPPVKATVPKPPTSFDFPTANQPLVGVIDTGFSANNPDIDYSQITLGKDFVDGDDNPLLQPDEGSEHGTHVLGIIAAQKDNDIGIDGINDDAPVWVGRAIGSGKWADSLVEFVDAAKESGQPNAVVNLSLDLTQINPDGSVTTRYEFTPQERAAIEYARQNNVLIVVAAGNDGGVMSALGQSSQEFDNIITVGAAERVNDAVAVSKAFDRADYSSYGYGLDIMADGGTVDNPILSTTGDSVGTMAGTSVASAKVTGAASQVWAANPNLSYRQVIELLKNTATDLKTPGWDAETGAGFLNMTAAVLLAKVTTPEVYDPEDISTPTTWGGENQVTPGERAVATQFLGKYYDWDSYTIKSGDTLGAIAFKTMGNSSATYYNFIAQKNGIANPNLIYPGQTILIPKQVSAPVNLNNTVGYDGTSTIQSYIDTSNRNGGKTILGSPTNNVHSWQSGYTQDFSGGSEGKGAIMKANGSTNSYWVGSDFWSKFLEVGSAGGILHYPTSDRYSTNSGWRQNFQGGAILKSAKGIFPVFGGIGAHYLNSENGEKGRLGFPISGEISKGNGVVIQNFENGRIVYGDGPTRTEMNIQPPNPVTSVTINGYTVNGNFYSIFKNYQGALGNPISGVVNHANGVTYQLFQNGSIVSSKYGTFPLYGGIRQTYLNNSGLNGWLGAPTSAEVPQGNGVVKQTFEGGYIIWNGKTATAYRTGSNQQPSSGYNLNLIPNPWKNAAYPYIPLLVKAFASQGITNPRVLAYAAATIGYESSWNPKAVNTTDAASKTGYPGAGLAQITWKSNYQAVSQITGIDFVNHPEYMFDPLKSLTAKAAFYKMNNMISLIEAGDYESAAGIYNAGNKNYRSAYTAKVAAAVPTWLGVFTVAGTTPKPSIPTTQPTPAQQPKPGYVNSNVGGVNLRLRTQASTTAGVITTLSQGTKLKILRSVKGGTYSTTSGNRNDWYEVEVNGKRGYVAAYYVNEGSNNNSGSSHSPLLTTQGAQYFKARPQFYGSSGNGYAKYGYGSSVLGTNKYLEGNCTWYAYGRLKELGFNPGDIMNGYPNANEWGNVLRNGAKIVKTPQPGDVAQWTKGQYGHVAVVEKVENGYIWVSESHAFSDFDGDKDGDGKLGGDGTLHRIYKYTINNPTRYIRLVK